MTYMSILWAALGTIGFCIIFHVPVKCMVPAIVTGGAAWFFYIITLDCGLSNTIAIFVGACVVAFLADFFSRMVKEAATIFVIPGILPLVPGAGIYYTLFYFIQGNDTAALQYGSQTLLTAGAIAMALITVSLLIRTFVSIKRHIRNLPEKMRNR